MSIGLGQERFGLNENAKLKWNLNLKRAEEKQLLEEKKIKRDLEIELIRGDDGRRLWPVSSGKNMASIVVEIREGGDGLTVNLREVRWKEFDSDELLGFGNFKCKWLGARAVKSKAIYGADLTRIQDGTYQFFRAYTPMRVEIALERCGVVKWEGPIECNLELKVGEFNKSHLTKTSYIYETKENIYF